MTLPSLALQPALRTWFNAGLDFLFIQDNARLAELKNLDLKENKKTEIAALNKSKSVVPLSALHSLSHVSERSSPRSSEDVKENEFYTSVNPDIPALPFATCKEHEWHDNWLNLWERTIKKSNPKVVWTYPGLHDDILGSPNEERKEFIRNLLKGLGHPAGTHAFWAFDMLNQQGKIELYQDASMFWSGVLRLKPRMILVFGSQARNALLLPSHRAYTSFTYAGYLIHILPDPNIILEKKQDHKTLLAFMKEILKMYKA